MLWVYMAAKGNPAAARATMRIYRQSHPTHHAASFPAGSQTAPKTQDTAMPQKQALIAQKHKTLVKIPTRLTVPKYAATNGAVKSIAPQLAATLEESARRRKFSLSPAKNRCILPLTRKIPVSAPTES